MFTIRLAETDIGIDNRYDFVQRQCAGYLSTGTPAFTVSVSEEEIREEWEKSTPEVKNSRRDKFGYSESISIYRKICYTMPLYDALLLHSAALSAHGGAYLFSAPSGTGKTTHLKLWMRTHPGEVTIINGDKPLLKKQPDGSFTVYGTPWSGKEGWQSNISAPLKGLCFLRRGEVNAIRRLDEKESADRVMKQIVYPKDPAALTKTLMLSNDILYSAPIWLLSCNISEEAARLSFDAMVKRGS